MDVRSRPRSLTLRPRRMGWGSREHRPDETRSSVGRTAQAAGRFELDGPRHSHRQGGPSEDRALYSCGCGYVFAALVSTSVDCPHCGDAQAW